ncbi:MAG: hypothetical protein CMJ67_09475 [Planctomycetaceae bacterium]|nr:hypothetical protein [Planctomycetaceae bacterium]
MLVDPPGRSFIDLNHQRPRNRIHVLLEALTTKPMIPLSIAGFAVEMPMLPSNQESPFLLHSPCRARVVPGSTPILQGSTPITTWRRPPSLANWGCRVRPPSMENLATDDEEPSSSI